jgi:hypothetical protein
MAFANSVFEMKFDAQMRLDPIGQVDAGGILNVSMEGIYGALQLGGKFKLGPVEIFGAMQLELNTTGGDRIIERVQYDFDTRTVSSGRIEVTLPAETQRVFVGGIMIVPGFELKGSFEMVNNPNEIRVSVDASFRAFDALFLGISGDVAIVKGTSPAWTVCSSWMATLASSSTPARMVTRMRSTTECREVTHASTSAETCCCSAMWRLPRAATLNLTSAYSEPGLMRLQRSSVTAFMAVAT